LRTWVEKLDSTIQLKNSIQLDKILNVNRLIKKSSSW